MYIQSEIFDNLINSPERGEYENCTFRNCNFSEANLYGSRFIDCTFEGCNLSMASVSGCSLQGVHFKECKMLGLRLDTVSEFGLSFSFENCQLNHSSFFRLKMKKTRFANCQMEGVDFGEGFLAEAVFDHCNLLQAIFDNTVLEKADLRTSFNFSIDPERNKLKKAKFSQSGLSGLLDKYQIMIDRNL